MRKILKLLCALLFASSFASAAATAVVGGSVSIKGRIEKVKLTSRKKFNPYGDMYVDKSEKAPAELLQQLIVYVDELKAGSGADLRARLSQKDKNFNASIVPILAGGSVEISNEDVVRHHIRSNAKPWDFNLKPRPPGETVTRTFDSKEASVGVVPVYCDIHSNMRAHVLVMPNPYFQVLPETGGKFSLKGLPAGTYTITAWHPTLKPQPVKVTVKANEVKTVNLVMLGKQD
jgi:plastocyanin